LDGGAVSNGLVGVDGSVGLFAVEKLGDHRYDLGNSGGAADQNDLMDLAFGHLAVTKHVFYWLHTEVEVMLTTSFEERSGDCGAEVLAVEQSVDFDGGFLGRRQNSLGLLTSGSQSSDDSGVGMRVDSLLHGLLDLFHAVLDQFIVEVFAAEMGVTSGGFDFENTVLNCEKGNVKGSASQVENEHMLFALTFLIQTVSDGGCSRLVENTQDVEIGDDARILGGLTLGVVEVSRDCDDCVVDLLVEELFGSLSHLRQDHGADFFGVESLLFAFEIDDDSGLVLAVCLNLEGPHFHVFLHDRVLKFTADESFGVEDCVFWVPGNLVFGRITDQSF